MGGENDRHALRIETEKKEGPGEGRPEGLSHTWRGNGSDQSSIKEKHQGSSLGEKGLAFQERG